MMDSASKAFQPKIVGITGGIGSGKSTVCRIFEWLNIPIYDSDKKAIFLINNDHQVKRNIKSLLGSKSYRNNRYDRKYVSSKVFKDKSLLNELNNIVHPAVAQDFNAWCLANKNSKYVLKEAAILFESGAYKQMNKIICVTAPKSLRIDRVMKRDGLLKKQVEARMKNQMNEEERIKRSDFVINNDELQLLVPQVMEIHAVLIR